MNKLDISSLTRDRSRVILANVQFKSTCATRSYELRPMEYFDYVFCNCRHYRRRNTSNATFIATTNTTASSAAPVNSRESFIFNRIVCRRPKRSAHIYASDDNGIVLKRYVKLGTKGKFNPHAVEALVYQQLASLQGRGIPICYGFYESCNTTGSSTFQTGSKLTLSSASSGRISRTFPAILLENCGRPLHSFEELNDDERLELMNIIIEIHELGILHGQVNPDNVVINDSTRDLNIVGFSSSRLGHRCAGPLHCEELLRIANELEVDTCFSDIEGE